MTPRALAATLASLLGAAIIALMLLVAVTLRVDATPPDLVVDRNIQPPAAVGAARRVPAAPASQSAWIELAEPAVFSGTVHFYSDNGLGPMSVTAWISNTKMAETTTTYIPEEAIYQISIPADDPATSNVKEGGAPGDPITFKVQGVTVDQAVVWQSGSFRLNLTVTHVDLCVLAYDDLDHNQVRGPTEPLLGGAVITITHEVSPAFTHAYTTTGISEPYCLTRLDLGTYSLREIDPPGYTSPPSSNIRGRDLLSGTLTEAFGDYLIDSPSPTPTDTRTTTPSPTPTGTRTTTPSPTTTGTPTLTPLPTSTSTTTPIPSPTPIATNTGSPTASPTPSPTPTRDPALTYVSLVPLETFVLVGQTVTIDVRIENVHNLYGAEFGLQFNPALVEVVDADGNPNNGVQIKPGTLFDPGLGFTAFNRVYTDTGLVEYAFSLLKPASAVTGTGTLASVAFRAKAVGTTGLPFDRVVLSDIEANWIDAIADDGLLSVSIEPPPTETPTATSSPTATPTSTASSTATPTSTASSTATPTSTASSTTTPTGTSSSTATPTGTSSPTVTPTGTLPTATPTATPSPSATPSGTSSPTVTPTGTLTPSVTPTGTASATVSPTATPSPSVTPTGTASPTSTASATATPTRTDTPSSTPTATATATATATHVPGLAYVVISPAEQDLLAGAAFTVEVRVEDATNLYGAAIRLQFDPSVLEVIDARPAIANVQIEPGPFPDFQGQGFIAANQADNVLGEVRYEGTLLGGSPVSGSGVLARIGFRGLAPGSSAVNFVAAQLLDRNSALIPSTTSGGQLHVLPLITSTPTPTATGSPTRTPSPTTTGTPNTATPTRTPLPSLTQIQILPQVSSVQVDDRTTLSVRIDDVSNLAFFDVRLGFDPSRLAVEDADPATPGIQIEPGSFPSGAEITVNAANNGAGQIAYGFRADSASGSGTLLRVTFRGLKPGSSLIDFLSLTMTSGDGAPIGAERENAIIFVQAATQTPTPTREHPVVLQLPIIARNVFLGPPAVRPDPLSQTMVLAGTTNVDVRIEGVNGLYQAEVWLRFNPSVLQVIDADSTTPGVQVGTGDFPSPSSGFLAANDVDSSTGLIRYAVIVYSANPPARGSGVLFRVTFRGYGVGTSSLTPERIILLGRAGQPLGGYAINGSVVVRPPATDTPTATLTPTRTPSRTPSPTRTPSRTPTITLTPTVTRTPTITLTPTVTRTPTITLTPTVTHTPTLTPTPTATRPTATPTTTPTGCVELVRDRSFEEDSEAWTFDGGSQPGRRSTANPRTGRWSALLGIVPPEPDAYTYSSVRQTVIIPPDARSATLSFWYWPASENVFSIDQQQMFIYQGAWDDRDFAAEVLRTNSNSRQWTFKTFDLLNNDQANLAGRTIHLYFNALNNFVPYPRTWMYVDDVSVVVCR